MVRLIRSIRTRKYFCSGEWVDNPSESTHYPDTCAALECIRREGLRDVEVVLQFGPVPSETYDVRVPVSRVCAR